MKTSKIYPHINLSTNELIFTRNIPINSAPQTEECKNNEKLPIFTLRKQPGIYVKVPLQKLVKCLTEFHQQHTNWFSSTSRRMQEPQKSVPSIFTSNALIDSARQAEECGNIKNVSNFISGAQLGSFLEKIPKL
jgi:hypothetical protein